MSLPVNHSARNAGNACQSSRCPVNALPSHNFPEGNFAILSAASRRSRQSSRLTCNVLSAPLAEYPFPTDVQRSGGSFTSAILHVVQHISNKPFLQCTYSRPHGTWHERHAAPASMVGNPEAWYGLAKELSTAGPPDHLMFIHPVDSPLDFCGRCNSSREAISSGLDMSCPLTTSEQCSLHGKICDESCDEHRGEEINAHRVLHTPDHLLDSGDLRRSGLHVEYYGLVAQSRLKDGSDGCYLLKIVQQLESLGTLSGCHCMHYSLMRVCQNTPLQQQALEFWL